MSRVASDHLTCLLFFSSRSLLLSVFAGAMARSPSGDAPGPLPIVGPCMPPFDGVAISSAATFIAESPSRRVTESLRDV